MGLNTKAFQGKQLGFQKEAEMQLKMVFFIFALLYFPASVVLVQSLILSTCMSTSTPTDQLAGRWLSISTLLKLKESQDLRRQQEGEEVSQTTSDGKKTMSGRLRDWSSFIIYLNPVEYSS